MKIIDFLKEYDISLGKLDTESGPKVERDENEVIKNNEENIETYREEGIDQFVEAAIEFNKKHIEDGQGNLFGDSVYASAVSAYYQAVPNELAPTIAELFIKNTGRVKECEEKETKKKTADCYIRRVFDVMVSAGLLRTFPVFSGTLSGAPIPVYNILPEKKPSGFATVFLSTLVPLDNASIFSKVSFEIDSTEFKQENRWVYKLSSDEISNDKEEKLGKIFEPKNADITYSIAGEEQDPSASALIFEGELDKVENDDGDKVLADKYDINVSYPGFSETFEIKNEEEFYVLEDKDEKVVALIKLPVYVADEPLEIKGTKLSNVENIRKYNDAPFFEDGGDWFFVAKEQQTDPLDKVNVKSAKIFDPPEFDISDIQDKSRNRQYEGFGATAFDPKTQTTKDVSSGKSILEDFFLFYKDYLEQNFAVVHVGITSSGSPTVSPPEQLKVTLEK